MFGMFIRILISSMFAEPQREIQFRRELKSQWVYKTFQYVSKLGKPTDRQYPLQTYICLGLWGKAVFAVFDNMVAW